MVETNLSSVNFDTSSVLLVFLGTVVPGHIYETKRLKSDLQMGVLIKLIIIPYLQKNITLK